MKKIVAMLVVLMLMVGCTSIPVVSENADDVYLTKVGGYLESLQTIIELAVNKDYETHEEMVKMMEDTHSIAEDLRKAVENLDPTTKYEADHEQIVLMFREAENFTGLILGMTTSDGDESINYKVKATESLEKLVEFSNKYLKEPFIDGKE